MEFYVLAYGNNEDKRQGIFYLDFDKNDRTINLLNFYATKDKPGSLIKKDNKLIMSSIDTESKQGYLTVFNVEHDNTLVEEKTIKQVYFYSSLNLTNDNKYLLGASFYEGVDSVFDIYNLGSLISTYTHQFRKRTEKLIQQACHSHYIGMTPDGKFIYSTDLGTDEVLVYNFSRGNISLNSEYSLDRQLGNGPRLMPFGKDGKYAYLLNELSNRVDVFSYNDGVFKEIQSISTLNESYSGESTAAGIGISQNGKFSAVSNRGEDSVAIYEIDSVSGFLTLKDRVLSGKKPRDIKFIGNDYILVCSQDDNKIEIIEISEKSVLLENFYSIPSPVFIK